MSNQDLFDDKTENKDNEQTPAPQDKVQQPNQNDYNPLLGMIVNADGEQKYKSVEDALKGASHANSHIANLEQQVRELQTAKDSAANLDDVIKAIQTQKDTPTDNSDPQQAITASDIQKMVESTIQNNTQQATAKENIAKVTGKFKELFGEKASETLYGKAENLGMSHEEINGLISTNPTAVFRMLGIDENNKQSLNTDVGNVNPQNFNQENNTPAPSSMGYISSNQLTENWLKTKERVNKELNS